MFSQLNTVINNCRNILRLEGITGMDSMKHLSLYTLSRSLTKEECNRFNISGEFCWENIITFAEADNKRQDCYDIFYNSQGNDLISHLDVLFGTRSFNFKLKNPDNHVDIIKHFNTIDFKCLSENVDILGTIYENHLSSGSNKSAMRDLGQYFTDRRICQYMVHLCKPVVYSDNRSESIIDPTMGTGGFLTSYVKYFNDNGTFVDWSKMQMDIAGYDIDDFVMSIGRINMYLSTGIVFDRIAHRDTLKDDVGEPNQRLKFKIILANEPFGVKGLKFANCCKRVKDMKLDGTKSEPLFLNLMMSALDIGGRCAVVVPDGFITSVSKQHNSTRKYMLDNFELKRVINMNGKFFTNTGINTTILFFENTGKSTNMIEFCELSYKQNRIEETIITSLSPDKLDENYSFDIRRYQTAAIAANPSEFPMMDLKDIVEYKNGKTPYEKIDCGNYDVMGGGMTYIGKTNTFNREGKTISISKSGSAGFISYHNKKYWAGDCLTITPKDSNCDIKYLYYYMKLNNQTMSNTTGTTIPHCKWDDIKNIKIPIPPLAIQQQIVTILDRIYSPGINELIESLTDSTISNAGLMQKSIQIANNVTLQMIEDIKVQIVAIVNSVKKGFPFGKIGENVSFMNGYPFKSEEFLTSGVPIVKIKNIKNSKLSFEKAQYSKLDTKLSKYIVKPNDIVISLTGELLGDIGINLSGVEWYLNQRVARIDIKNKAIHPSYLYYYMVYSGFTEDVRNLSTGSAQPNVSTKKIESLMMPLPTPEFQEYIIPRLNALQIQLTSLEDMGKQSEDNARFILESYLH